MARTIAEADWKVLRRLHPLALERFCERVLAEIEQVMQDRARSAHQRYVEVFGIVERRDRDVARLFDDLRRSQALTMLIGIRAEGLVSDEELSALSPETRNVIEMLLRSA